MSEKMKLNAVSASAIAGKMTVLVRGGVAAIRPVAARPAILLSGLSPVPAAASDGGLLRSQLTVPVSPVQQPADTVLFEQPADPNQKLYLPRYAVSQQTVSGALRYRMLFKKSGTTTLLVIHLAKSPAPELKQVVGPGTPEVPHTPSVRLVLPAPFQGKSELVFNEVVAEEGGVSATLSMDNLDEVNQVFNALTDTSTNSGTRLIVSRSIQAGVMITLPAAPGEVDQLNGQKASIQNEMAGLQAQAQSIGGSPDPQAWINNLQAQIAQHLAAVNQLQASIPGLVAQVADVQQEIADTLTPVGDPVGDIQLPPGERPPKPVPRPHPNLGFLKQLRAQLAEAQAQLNAANNAIQQNQAAITATNASISQLQGIIAKLGADQNLLNQANQRLDEINNPRFTVISPKLEEAIDPQPFTFRLEVFRYIYSALTGGDAQGLAVYQQNWNGRVYHYYQNPAESNVFYYLPDIFKQDRFVDTPHKPKMRMQFNITGASTGGVQAMLDYQVVPWVDLRRLAAAASDLSAHIGDGESSGVQYEPLPVSSEKVSLFLVLPPANTPQNVTAIAQVDFQNGITGTLSMSLDDFQNAFSAMLGGSLTLLTGHVHIKLNDQDSDDVALAIRMDDLVGEIFDYQVAPDSASGGVQVTLCNAIESPLQVNSLSANLARGTAQASGVVQGINPALPVTLQPGDSLRCVVAPAGALPGDGSLSVQFDVSGVKALPNHDKVFDAILDPNTPAEYRQPITAETFAQTYSSAADLVTAVLIQFEHGESIVGDGGTPQPGNTAQMDASHLNALVNIRLPIRSFVTGKLDEGEYRYKLTVIRGAAQVQDAQWRMDSRTTLPVTIGDVPNH